MVRLARLSLVEVTAWCSGPVTSGSSELVTAYLNLEAWSESFFLLESVVLPYRGQ